MVLIPKIFKTYISYDTWAFLEESSLLFGEGALTP
jgi:hypothetical protein